MLATIDNRDAIIDVLSESDIVYVNKINRHDKERKNRTLLQG